MIANYSMSTNMRTAVDKVLEGITQDKDSSSVANITMRFSCKSFPDLTVLFSREIDEFTIHQDFIENYTDKITAKLTIGIDEYVTLAKLNKDLECKVDITFMRADHGSTEVNEKASSQSYSKPADISMTYKAVITNLADIFKLINPARLQFPSHENETDKDRPELKLNVELIDATVHKARKKILNGVYRDVKMEQVIRYVISSLGFTEAHVAAPDNTKVYTNFIIPPMHYIEDIMGFLQTGNGLGIYRNGLCSYISQGVYYVYPRYGEPSSKFPIHIYSLGDNRAYSMLERFDHADDDDPGTHHIIINEGISETNYSPTGTENSPTAYNVFIDEIALLAGRRLTNDGEMEANAVTANFVTVPSDPMSTDEFVKVEYRKQHGNEFALWSDLQAMQGTKFSFTWNKARPFIFRPSTVVNIHDDDPQYGYKVTKGICERATYTFKKTGNSALMPLFICSAKVDIECRNIKKDGSRNQKY